MKKCHTKNMMGTNLNKKLKTQKVWQNQVEIKANQTSKYTLLDSHRYSLLSEDRNLDFRKL